MKQSVAHSESDDAEAYGLCPKEIPQWRRERAAVEYLVDSDQTEQYKYCKTEVAHKKRLLANRCDQVNRFVTFKAIVKLILVIVDRAEAGISVR